MKSRRKLVYTADKIQQMFADNGYGSKVMSDIKKMSFEDALVELEEIVETKRTDRTAADMDAAVRTIAGSARAMGLNVED